MADNKSGGKSGDKPDENLYKAEYQGSGTFLITKPKRKPGKLRQSRLKHLRRGARK